MKTNEIKKGMRVKLANGWEADIMDNKKGNTRLAKVFGNFTEVGSIYSADIIEVNVDGVWTRVSHTTKQINASKALDNFLQGF